jgi:hypothetical protein
MRPLELALRDHELIVLRVLGEWWEMDLTGADKRECVAALTAVLSMVDLPQEMNYVSPEEKSALAELIAAGGRVPVAAFSRRHGEVRLMGPGRLEREEPWFDPVGAAEALWYRGFLYRGFDETADGLIEFYYLPDELMAQFPQSSGEGAAQTAVEPELALTPVEQPESWETAVTHAVDDLTTLLAIAQSTPHLLDRQESLAQYLQNANTDRESLLMTLADEMGLLRRGEQGLRPTRAALDWLKKNREAQLQEMAYAWSSSIWNELCHTPGLRCEGEGWQNDPLLARTTLLTTLAQSDAWYDLADLIAVIKEKEPDFQRPDGNYDTWYIRDVASDAYVRGFTNWDLVEGRLLRFLVTGPLFWLGLAETAVSHSRLLFRLTKRALAWLQEKPPAGDEIRIPLVVQEDCTLLVPHNASRYQRFRAARVGEMQPVQAGQPYAYRLTPRSLARAREEGIAADRILAFLAEASDRPLPASVRRAVSRWQERGVEGRLETAVILRVKEASILKTLRTNPRTRDFLGESLGDLAVIVQPGQWQPLREATAELGLMLDALPFMP